jgi:hypothetical protein
MGGKSGGGGKSKKNASNNKQSKRLFATSVSQSHFYSLIQKLVAILIGIAAVRLPWTDLLDYVGTLVESGNNDGSKNKSKAKSSSSSSSSKLHQCNYYMGRSTIANGGWGVFTKSAIAKDTPVLNPELILQVPDIVKTQASGMHRILNDYMWDAKVTGGHLEGVTATFSVWPGLGMLANGHLTAFDVVPDQARRHPVT